MVRSSVIGIVLLIAPIWNWNRVLRWVEDRAEQTFNRTNMELKLSFCTPMRRSISTFNRTNMELKRRSSKKALFIGLLLIAPIWNWNLLLQVWCLLPVGLLIAPIWNWNMNTSWKHLQMRQLLIAPIWNWNQLLFDGFVCDFVLLIAPIWNWNFFWDIWQKISVKLLIAPIWNWNRLDWGVPPRHDWAFNRTNMELKHVFRNGDIVSALAFNRTNMELKRAMSPTMEMKRQAFNRTNMELKLPTRRDRPNGD